MAVTMENVIAQATGNRTYKVTRNQLLAAYCELSPQSASKGCFRMLVALGFIFVCAPMAVVAAKPLAAAIGLVFAGVLLSMYMWPGPGKNSFDELYEKYVAAGGTIPELLTPQAVASPPPGSPEPDIYAYGVQRLMMVDDDAVVDLLVSNNFHAQHQIAIVSINGYPGYLMPVVDKLLANPALKIYLLHSPPSKSSGSFYHRVAGDPRIGHRGQNILTMGFTADNVSSLPTLAKLPKELTKELPIDMVPYATLSGLLAEAINLHQSFTTVLALRKVAHKTSASSSSSGGFFVGGGYDFG
jgi:hypothetical protein